MEQFHNKGGYGLPEILNKEQFKIKLPFKYYLASGINIIFASFCVFAISDFVLAASVYMALTILGFRFIFNKTKNGGHLTVIVFSKAALIQNKIRKRANDLKMC